MSWDFDPFPSLSKKLRSFSRSSPDNDGVEVRIDEARSEVRSDVRSEELIKPTIAMSIA